MDILSALSDEFIKKGLVDAWAQEHELIAQRIASLNRLHSELSFTDVLGVGGGGIVLRVQNSAGGPSRALKFPRPSPDTSDILSTLLRSEAEKLIDVSHPNIMRLHHKGDISGVTQPVPYYIMDCHDDAQEADDYAALPSVTEAHLVSVIHDAILAVNYLHARNIVHLDIKPPNLLVRQDGSALLTDFGFAKFLRLDATNTLVGGTIGFIHPDLQAHLTEAVTDPNRARTHLVRSAIKASWDLYALGKTIFVLLDRFRRTKKRIDLYTVRYLRLLAARLLDGHVSSDERALGLSDGFLRNVRYTIAADALADIRKLRREHSLLEEVPELNASAGPEINISSVADTPMTQRVQDLIEHPTVLRLEKFSQLGLVRLVYRTARHSRFEHSLGTFAMTCRFVRGLLSDGVNPLFKQLMNSEDVCAVLLAALLHDLGQFPLAHDLEEACSEFSHSRLTEQILLNADASLLDILESKQRWGTPLARILGVLGFTSVQPISECTAIKNGILRTIIDGPLDADKVDYLVRDGEAMKVPYAKGIDIKRLLKCLTVVVLGDMRAVLGIHEKGRMAAEGIAFARYELFASAYWHHTHRAAKAMVHRLVWEAMLSSGGDSAVVAILENSLFPDGNPINPQRTIFDSSEPWVGAFLNRVSMLDDSDLAILLKLGSLGGGVARYLVEALEARRLYKRAFVITKASGAWMSVRNDFLKSWKNRLLLQFAFQALVEKELRDLSTTNRLSGVAAVDVIAKVDWSQALILVDYPSREVAMTDLSCVMEDDRVKAKSGELVFESLEKSETWQTLNASFEKNLSKVRVFCDRGVVDLVKAVPRDRIEKLLDEAADIGRTKIDNLRELESRRKTGRPPSS